MTRGTTIAEICNFSLGECMGEIVKVVVECSGDVWEMPAIPEILTFRVERGRWRDCAIRSEMKEVDEPESSRPQARM